MTIDLVEGTAPDDGGPGAKLVLRGRSLVIVGLIVLVIGWLARPVIGPFIVAAVIAYAFSPVGPLIATAIAGTDAFAHGGAGLALAVVVFYFVVRQVEDQVVMPVVVGRAVHLHPVVTIFAVLVGLSTYGVVGGLLGVPIAAAVNVIFRELGEPEGKPEVAPT